MDKAEKGSRVRLAHVLPRRVRIEAPSLAGRRDACEQVARELARGARWTEVRVRPSTGSIVLRSDTPITGVEELVELVRAIVPAPREDAAREDRGEGEPTRIAEAVARATHDINKDVRRGLGGYADLATLVPGALLGWGLFQVATREVPRVNWSNLLWWSVQAFVGWNRDRPEPGSRSAPR